MSGAAWLAVLAAMGWRDVDYDILPMADEGRRGVNWNDYFFGIMRAVAAKSKDESAKVGAVIAGPDHAVLSVGYNGFPRGVRDDDPERSERPAKYLWTEHAERNAIYNAARVGTRLARSVIYLPCPPCSACARAIIQAGILDVRAEIGAADFLPARSAIAWQDDIETACEMLEEAGVVVDVINPPEVREVNVYYNGPRNSVVDRIVETSRAIQQRFGVTICGKFCLHPPESDSREECDACGASLREMPRLQFCSRFRHLWTLCVDRDACLARITGGGR